MSLEMKDPVEEVVSVRFLLYELYPVAGDAESVPVPRFPVFAVSIYLILLTSTGPLVRPLLGTFRAPRLSEVVF